MSGDSCAKAQLDSMRKMPTILFVIDGSGSMCAPFGGSTRWQSLRTALLDPTNGLIYRLQQSVSFGMMLYDGTIDFAALVGGIGAMGGGGMTNGCEAMYFDKKAEGDCPGLVELAPAVGNAMAIDMMYPATELGGSTPTDKAMNRAVDQMIAMVSTNPDVVNIPLYIILATDGQPNDICAACGRRRLVQRAGVIAPADARRGKQHNHVRDQHRRRRCRARGAPGRRRQARQSRRPDGAHVRADQSRGPGQHAGHAARRRDRLLGHAQRRGHAGPGVPRHGDAQRLDAAVL